jgi:hypothetical protein
MTLKGMKQIKWSQDEDEVLSDCYHRLPKKELQEKLPLRSWKALIARANSLGLSRDREHIERGILDFSVIDSEEKAYLLGLFAADGNVNNRMNTFEIRLHGEDGVFLYNLAEILGSQCRVVERPARMGLSGVMGQIPTELRIYSKKLCKDLYEHGVTPRKTYTVLPPPAMPTDLTRHYIRGYTDGDGSVSYTLRKADSRGRLAEITVHSASNGLLNWINEEFKRFYNHKSNVSVGHGAWWLHYVGGTAYQFVRYTYECAKVSLPRKLNMANDILRLCNEKGVRDELRQV